MSEDSVSIRPESENVDRFKQIVAILIAVVTVLGVIVAYLQSDASSLDEQADRDSKRYALEALGRKVSGDARVNYDYNTAYQTWLELSLLEASVEQQDDPESAKRYATLKQEMSALSSLLEPEYFNAETSEVNIELYEVDVYLNEVTVLMEKFDAASVVKDAWDYKSNTYIVHLTLLAVTLFLFGLSATISGPVTRWVFAALGSAIALLVVVWMISVWAQPVYDLRAHSGAIEKFAEGEGLLYQERWEEAVLAFNQVLDEAPAYAKAYAERADAYMALGNYAASAADYEKALAAGYETRYVWVELGWNYYLLGQFDKAIALGRSMADKWPDDIAARFNLALALLASGQTEEAKAEYEKGMNIASRQVAEVREAGGEPPFELWWALDDAAFELDRLLAILDGEETDPPVDSIHQPESVQPLAETLIVELKSLSATLEWSGKPVENPLSPQIGPFAFGVPEYDDNAEVIDYEIMNTFPSETNEVSILFDYEGMQDGREVIFKVYYEGEEDPSWRTIGPWEFGPSGSADFPLSLAYSASFVFSPGQYEVEMYVDYRLVQRGWFEVLDDETDSGVRLDI